MICSRLPLASQREFTPLAAVKHCQVQGEEAARALEPHERRSAYQASLPIAQYQYMSGAAYIVHTLDKLRRVVNSWDNIVSNPGEYIESASQVGPSTTVSSRGAPHPGTGTVPALAHPTGGFALPGFH